MVFKSLLALQFGFIHLSILTGRGLVSFQIRFCISACWYTP